MRHAREVRLDRRNRRSEFRSSRAREQSGPSLNAGVRRSTAKRRIRPGGNCKNTVQWDGSRRGRAAGSAARCSSPRRTAAPGRRPTTSVLIRALRQRGLSVQAFKIGPDFIDAAYHAEATGRPSINLDVWMMGEEGVRRSFRRWSREADVSVIESMGALYDGADGADHGSAGAVAEAARRPGRDRPRRVGDDPNAHRDPAGPARVRRRGADRRVPAEPRRQRRACRAGPGRDAPADLRQTRARVDRAPAGAARRRAPSRSDDRRGERDVADRRARRSRAAAAERIDIGRLLAIVAAVDAPRGQRVRRPGAGDEGAAADVGRAGPHGLALARRLAIARDEAFCFYYEENLIALRDVGFELVPFRPTIDARPPAGADAVYIGGGYPESFAARLAANRTLAGRAARARRQRHADLRRIAAG